MREARCPTVAPQRRSIRTDARKLVHLPSKKRWLDEIREGDWFDVTATARRCGYLESHHIQSRGDKTAIELFPAGIRVREVGESDSLRGRPRRRVAPADPQRPLHHFEPHLL